MEPLAIDRSIERYARLFVLGDIWADTLDCILKFWSDDFILYAYLYSVLQQTLYLDEIQKQIEANEGMTDWFKDYAAKINLMASFLVVKAKENPEFQQREYAPQIIKDNIDAFRNTFSKLNEECRPKAEAELQKEDLRI